MDLEAEMKAALDGHFWTVVYDGKMAVVDMLETKQGQQPRLPRKVWDDGALMTLWELKRKGHTTEEVARMMGRDKRIIADQWSRRRQWTRKVVKGHWEPLTLVDIRRVVCAVYQVGEADFCSESRMRKACDARQAFYWIARRFTKQSTPQIGAAAGGRDHSTVVHGAEKVTQQYSDYRPYVELALMDLGLEFSPERAA